MFLTVNQSEPENKPIPVETQEYRDKLVKDMPLRMFQRQIRKSVRELAKTRAQEITNELEELSKPAIIELKKLLHSEDEQVRTKNVHYVIDHNVGKAVARTENKNFNVSIDMLAD